MDSEDENCMDRASSRKRGVKHRSQHRSSHRRLKARRSCRRVSRRSRTRTGRSRRKVEGRRLRTTNKPVVGPNSYIYRFFLNTIRQVLSRMGRNTNAREVNKIGRKIWNRLTDEQRATVAKDAQNSKGRPANKVGLLNSTRNKMDKENKSCQSTKKRGRSSRQTSRKKRTTRRRDASENRSEKHTEHRNGPPSPKSEKGENNAGPDKDSKEKKDEEVNKNENEERSHQQQDFSDDDDASLRGYASSASSLENVHHDSCESVRYLYKKK